MVIFLYGNDDYRLIERRAVLADAYTKKLGDSSAMEKLVCDCNDDEDFKVLENTFKTISFFDTKKIIIIKNLFHQASAVSAMIERWDLFKNPSYIIIATDARTSAELKKIDTKLFNALSKSSERTEVVDLLAGPELRDWAKSITKSAGLTIQSPALESLILGTSEEIEKPRRMMITKSWRVAQELGKLINYTTSQGRQDISIADVQLLVPQPALKIFDLVDAIAGKRGIRSMALLNRCFEQGDDAHELFPMIIYQFRNLLMVKSLIEVKTDPQAIVAKTKLHPFVAQKTQQQSRSFSLPEIKAKFLQLAQLEKDTKHGLISMKDGLYQFVLST